MATAEKSAPGACAGVETDAAPSVADVPSWLEAGSARDFEPTPTREGFLRRNVLRLTGLLTDVRVGASSYGPASSPVDRALRIVPVPLRLLGLVVSVASVSVARNMLFVYLMLALVLVAAAMRPAEAIARQAAPAVVAALVSALVTLPAALMGAPSILVRMTVRVFVSLMLVLGLSQEVPWNRLIGALRSWHLPSTVVLVVDLALRDLVLLGQSALSLSEALSLRSVGAGRDGTGSAAGVMGTCFLRAHSLSTSMGEAMACRGFDGDYETSRERDLTPAGVVYVVGLVFLVACLVWLEGAM